MSESGGTEADDELVIPRDERPLAVATETMQDVQPSLGYAAKVKERLSSLSHAVAKSAPISKLLLEPVLTLFHGSPVHVMVLPHFGHHLFTAGQDGFIRRYALYDSLNGIDSPKNLIMKQAGLSAGVLVGYWESTDTLDTESPTALKWGPRSVSSLTSGRAGGTPVFSMVVQSQEIWGISGSQDGEMNLWTVRFDEGQVRHVFKSSADAKTGHARSSAVSALCLTPDEQGLFSGGWDSRILVRLSNSQECPAFAQAGGVQLWDLNTGQAVRAFRDRDQHFATESVRANQVSSLSLHPLVPASAPPDCKAGSPIIKRESNAVGDHTGPTNAMIDVDAEGSPTADFDPLFDQQSPAPSPRTADGEQMISSDRESVQIPDYNDGLLPALSQDVLLASSISGQVLVYDRRADKGGAVRRLPIDPACPPWAMSARWSTTGDQIFVGRRHAKVDIYDFRAGAREVIDLPDHSGPVSAVLPSPNGRHLLTASWDSLRIHDLQHDGKGLPFEVVPNFYGTTVSQLECDASGKLFMSASGGRGWESMNSSPDRRDGVNVYSTS